MTDPGPQGPTGRLEETGSPSPKVLASPSVPARSADPWAMVLGILGGVLLGTGVTFAVLGFVGVFEEPTPPTIPPAPVLTAPPPTGPPPTLGGTITAASVAERVVPSTVFVEAGSLFTGSSGSGVVYSNTGYIVTNHHVIQGASEVFVTFTDGARFPAEVIGSDPVTDIAVLLVDREDMFAIELGSSDALKIGEPALAVGNPLGLAGGPTVTTGIVSALNRSLSPDGGETLYGLVQTDAPIAPGSSGGALVDARGTLIGITTAIAVSSAGAEGLGFAVPIDLVIGVVADLVADGSVDHALLGITGSTAWVEEGDAEYPVGILVTETGGDSAYEAAGGQINDVIVEIAGQTVTGIDDLLGNLRRHRGGETIQLRILRADAETNLDVVLGSLN